MGEVLSDFFALTINSRRKVRGFNRCQGRRGVWLIFLVVFDASRCLKSAWRNVARILIGLFAHLCNA